VINQISLRTLRLALVGQKDPTPGIHDALTERDDVVKHFHSYVGTGCDGRCLLKDLGDDRQVYIKLSPDSLGNVSKGFENRGLKLIGGTL
jgi:hypothetical protein